MLRKSRKRRMGMLGIAGVLLLGLPAGAAPKVHYYEKTCGPDDEDLTCDPTPCRCDVNWDDINPSRWTTSCSQNCESNPIPNASNESAEIERSNNSGAPNSEDWLILDLPTVTIYDLTILVDSENGDNLVLRFASKDKVPNTLTCNNSITVDGVNGEVSFTLEDWVTVTGDTLTMEGNGNPVTVTVEDGAELKTE